MPTDIVCGCISERNVSPKALFLNKATSTSSSVVTLLRRITADLIPEAPALVGSRAASPQCDLGRGVIPTCGE